MRSVEALLSREVGIRDLGAVRSVTGLGAADIGEGRALARCLGSFQVPDAFQEFLSVLTTAPPACLVSHIDEGTPR